MPIAIQLQGFRIVHWREPWRILNFPTNFLGFVCPICSIMFPFFHEFCSFDINFLFINIDAAGEACGTILSVQLYCLTGYHCCDKDLYTCCATGYICAGSSCISIAVIIVPIIIVIVIILVIVVIIVKKNNARQGVVIQPGQQQGIGNQPPGYGNPTPGYNQGPAPY